MMFRQGSSATWLLIVLGAAPFASSSPAATWEAAASTNVTREYPGLVLLPDGKVLAVTGHPLAGQSVASAELYDPRQNVWTPTGSLQLARNGVQPEGLIMLPGGKVLIAGSGSANRSVHEAELYDYKSGTWTTTGSMHVPRCVHAATQLASGQVLVTGGIDWLTEQVHASTEVYDEATGEWTKTGAMATPRFNHHAVRLSDGRVLACGGNSDYPEDSVEASAEIFDPSTGTWRETTPMNTARRSHALVTLADGRVLAAGGSSGALQTKSQLSAAEVFDPRTEKWTDVAPLREARWGPTATLLPTGQVLLTGGAIGPFGARRTAELFDPATATWSDAGSLRQPRNGHRAIALNDSRILIVGGHFLGKYLASCELYVP
jgi:hypothetical protein